jgi:hypothetical protein
MSQFYTLSQINNVLHDTRDGKNSIFGCEMRHQALLSIAIEELAQKLGRLFD